jgi:hypothetical protein
MGFEGKQLNPNVVMFGEPVNEKALRALEGKSPTADQIIKSLPPTAFMPTPTPSKREIEEQESVSKKAMDAEVVVSAIEQRKERIKKKKELALKKRQVRQVQKNIAKEEQTNNIPIKEPILVQKIIEAHTKDEELIPMNLEEELQALESEVKPRTPTPPPEAVIEPQPQADLKSQILELLDGEDDPPSTEQIEAWKAAYGKNGVHVMAFGGGDVYIYHHLTRGEWKKIKEVMNRMKDSENSDEVEEKLKEKVVLYCILWPSVDEHWLEYCKAGILDSLYQMILLNSGFLTPQQAMLLTTQL